MVAFILEKMNECTERSASWKNYFANSINLALLPAFLGAISYPCCKASTSLTSHSKSYKTMKSNKNVWLATSTITIQISTALIFLTGPHQRSHQCTIVTIMPPAAMLDGVSQCTHCAILSAWQVLHLQQ